MDRLTVHLANRKRVATLLIVLLAGGILGMRASAVPTGGTTGGRIPAPRQGFLAPEFELDTLDGGVMSLADFEGRVVLINLWATWCPPCRAEMPAIQSLYTAYREQGLAVLAINMTYQDNAAEVMAFAREYGLTFPILLDRSGQVGQLYHLRALPSTFLLDRQGVIQEVVVGGPLSELTLRSMITNLLMDEP